jgi:serine/threonine-protein kinase
MDFGVARPTASRAQENLRVAETEILTGGTVALMAPEQILGLAIDARADVYAVGTLAFQCLAGRLPFESRSFDAILSAKVLCDPPTLVAATGEDWPADVEDFLTRCLARDREQRFSDAAKALAAWRNLCAKHVDHR